MTSQALFLGTLAQTAKAGNTQAAKLLSQLTAATPAKKTATPSVFTNTTVNQGAVFGPINVTPTSISGSLSLFGGGGGSTGGVNISQVSQPTSNVSTQVSNVFTTTNTYPTTVTNQYTSNVSNVTSSPFAQPTTGTTQTATAPTTVTPTVTPSQVATQTATPTTTTDQTGSPAGGMSWWQYLIIGGVAVVGIYYISQALKSRTGGKAKYGR
jgi:hypothetical protein